MLYTHNTQNQQTSNISTWDTHMYRHNYILGYIKSRQNNNAFSYEEHRFYYIILK